MLKNQKNLTQNSIQQSSVSQPHEQSQNQIQLAKVHTRKEAAEAVRLQLTLNEAIACKLRKFYLLCGAAIVTFTLLLVSFYWTASTGTVDIISGAILAVLFMLEGAGLYKYRQYNPISVHRAMLHEHDYGLVLCAIRGSGSYGHRNFHDHN